jgi:NAD(P)-dependent dehydrogenase (short-subunit alcohol dehydrogenase family)
MNEIEHRDEREIRSLRGKRVVIVGGASGMGLGAARAAAHQGAKVIIASRRQDAVQEATESVTGDVVPAAVDVTDESSIRELFGGLQGLDHLFITASPGRSGAFLEQDVAAARRYMDGKFFGSWACARYAAPVLEPGGSITFLSGGLAVRPEPGRAMVTAAFAAVEALARALAVELSPRRVNTIRPGFIDSSMWDFLDESERERMREEGRASLPVRRVGAVEDIGQAAVFLMTNPYVTGSVVEVNGGQLLI